MGIENGLNKARVDLESEVRLLVDEECRGIYSDIFNAFEKIVNKRVQSGRLTQEQAEDELWSGRDYFISIPEVYTRLEEKMDEDGWLTRWLTRHPEYVEEDLGGQWPEWLPRQDSQKGDINIVVE